MNPQTHSNIVDAAYNWIMHAGKCKFAFKEMHSTTSEIPDILGFMDSGWSSVLIECKASRSDFLADKKKQFRIHPNDGMGKFRFYCCPTNMIRKDEVPEKWGLIYVGKTGHARAVINPLKHKYSPEWLFSDRSMQSEMRMMFTALRFTERGMDLQKSISIGQYICQYDWSVPNKMPEYPEEVAMRLQTTVKEMQDMVDFLNTQKAY